MLLLKPFLAKIFDRSTTPLAKFAACGLIGALVVGVPASLEKRPLDFWSRAITGAGLGYSGAAIAWLYDRSHDPSVSRRTRVFAKLLMITTGLLVCISAVIVIDLVLPKR